MQSAILIEDFCISVCPSVCSSNAGCVEMVVNVVKRFQRGDMDFVVVFRPQPALQNSDAKILNGVLNEGKYEFFGRNRRTLQKRYDIG